MAREKKRTDDNGKVQPLTYMEQRFDDFVAAHARVHELEQKALNLAHSNMGLRLDRLNELRDVVTSVQNSFSPKAVIEGVLDRLRVVEGRVIGILLAGSILVTAAGVAAGILQFR